MRNQRTNKRGFTLLELLMAIAIMGILMSVVFAATNSHRAKARDARRISEVHSIKDAVELYFSENGVYPAALSDIASNFNGTLPVDPVTHSSYLYIVFTDTSKHYCLAAYMENRHGSGACTNSIGDVGREKYVIEGP